MAGFFMRGRMAGMRMWLIMLAVALPVGELWFRIGLTNPGKPVLYAVGLASGCLFFCIAKRFGDNKPLQK
jgi:hypothetical protein